MDEAVIHKKLKIDTLEMSTFFCNDFQSIVNLQLKFWDYNKKNVDFHLTPESTTSDWGLVDENAMEISYFKSQLVTISNKHPRKTTYRCYNNDLYSLIMMFFTSYLGPILDK